MSEKKTCDVCFGEFSPRYFTAHRRKQHGIRVRRSPGDNPKKASKPSPPAPAASNHLPVPRTPPTQKQNFTVLPYLVLEDGQGSMWIAERIR